MTTSNALTVQFRRLSEGATLPTFGTPLSACMDLYACLMTGTTVRLFSSKNVVVERHLRENRLTISPMERILVPTGFAVACPPQHSMRIYSRSGLALKQGLIVVNGVGVVDEDYRHEVFVLMTNISNCACIIRHGDRIAQAEFQPQQLVSSMVIDEVADDTWFTTSRNGGFGSTGL